MLLKQAWKISQCEIKTHHQDSETVDDKNSVFRYVNLKTNHPRHRYREQVVAQFFVRKLFQHCYHVYELVLQTESQDKRDK